MRPRFKERLLVAIVAALLITLVLFAAALFRAAGRAHFLIVPNLSAPKERVKTLYFEPSANHGPGVAGAQVASPLPRSGQPALSLLGGTGSVRSASARTTGTSSLHNCMPSDSGMFGVTKESSPECLGVSAPGKSQIPTGQIPKVSGTAVPRLRALRGLL